MKYCVTKAVPIHFIDGKCHIKVIEIGRICKTCLANHIGSLSHHIMQLVINGFKGRHTHIRTNA